MRILIVEDDASYADTLARAIAARCAGATLDVVGGRDEALDVLARELPDVVICDLRIPANQGGMDADVDHGVAVCMAARTAGLYAIALTAFSTVPVVSSMLRNVPRADFLGTGMEEDLFEHYEKDQLVECLERIAACHAHIHQILQVDVFSGSEGVELSAGDRRVVQLYAKRHGGARALVAPLGGGLSGARTFRVRVTSAEGALVSLVVAKLGSRADIEDERRRFAEGVAPRLSASVFTPVVGCTIAGAAGVSGLFYSLATTHDASLFERGVLDSDLGPQVVNRLRTAFRVLREGAPVRRMTVRDIRRLLASDEEALRAGQVALERGIATEAFESLTVDARVCWAHGDLHGENVLVDRDGNPLVIDYARVGLAVASLDPILLELGLIFHPAGPGRSSGWPTVAQAPSWRTLGTFLNGCPAPEFVRACREWTFDEHDGAASEREVWAVLYAVAVRQLRFPDVDPDLAAAFIDLCVSRLQG